jgi:pimeloyl-ACP methyl ester carboxylesterase
LIPIEYDVLIRISFQLETGIRGERIRLPSLLAFKGDAMSDPVVQDQFKGEPRASIDHFIMKSEGQRLVGVMFRPQGEGPHPTAVLLHGFPGHDINLDIAHTLRRGGWNTLVFHYRGSWGSEGVFTFSNMLTDTENVLIHLIKNSERLKVSTEKLMLLGHSMGGWAALMIASRMKEVRYLVNIAGFDLGGLGSIIAIDEIAKEYARSTFQELVIPLKVESVEFLLHEAISHKEEWSATDHIEELKDRSLLLIGATNDKLSLPELNYLRLKKALEKINASDLSCSLIDSDHSFSDGRIELQRKIWDWISHR